MTDSRSQTASANAARWEGHIPQVLTEEQRRDRQREYRKRAKDKRKEEEARASPTTTDGECEVKADADSDVEEFCGDPVESICGLLLLVGNRRLEKFARESIATEVDRYLQPLYSANKSTVAMERFQRTQAAYAMSYVFNNKPVA
jgi:hypothetical protein